MRRLLDQGVRFVQVFHGRPSNDWDAHGDLPGNHKTMTAEYDRLSTTPAFAGG